MKKFIKLFGLLIIGFVFAGCGGANNPGKAVDFVFDVDVDADIDAEEIALTDGYWNMAYSSSFEGVDASGANFESIWVDASRIQVVGDVLTILNGTYSQSYVYAFPEATAESDINAFAQQKKAEQDARKVQQEQAGLTLTTVSFEHTGRTVRMIQAYEKTAEQLERQNQSGSVSAMNSGLLQDAQDIVIKTNSSGTAYKVTCSIPADPDVEDDVDRDIVLVFKKL